MYVGNNNTHYFVLVAATMQSSLVHMFGDPNETALHSRLLAANNITNNNTVVDTLLHLNHNATSANHNHLFDESICFEECTTRKSINSTYISSNSINFTDTTNKINENNDDDGPICWNECVDLHDNNSEEDGCRNECITLNTPKTSISASNATNETNTNTATDNSLIGFYFSNPDNFTFSDLNDILNENKYDVVCWRECKDSPLVVPVINEDEPQTFIDFMEDMLSDGSELYDEETINKSDKEILVQCLQLYGSVFLICFFIFCVVRKVFPRAYNLRSGWLSEENVQTHSMAKKDTTGFFSWIWKVWLVSDTELQDECGMDALCLIRVLDWGAQITLLGSLVGCIILMPVYATAGGDHKSETGVERLNTSNVQNGDDGRFVATVLSAYLIFGYVMYTALGEFEWFYKFRYQFLSRPIPRNYVVYVRNLSKEHRTRTALIEYFSHFEDPSVRRNRDQEQRRLLASEQIIDKSSTKAWVSLKIPRLNKLVEKRAKILSNLEHQINVQEVCNSYPKSRDDGTGEVITLVDALFVQLKELNVEIKASIERIEKRSSLDDPYDYNADDYKNPYEVDDGLNKREYSGGHESSNPNLFFDAVPIDDKSRSSIYMTAKSKEWFSTERRNMTGKGFSETTDITSADQLDSDSSASTDQRGSNIGKKLSTIAMAPVNAAKTSVAVVGSAAKTSAVIVGSAAKTSAAIVGTKVDHAAHAVGDKLRQVVHFAGTKDDDGVPMTAGFVAFSSLKACQAAKQMIHSSEVFGMEVLEAPEFNDVFWQNVGKAHKELEMGILLSYSLTGVLCLFWSFVMIFIAAVSSVQGLVLIVPFINQWLENAPWLELVLAQLSPLMIYFADEALKFILEVISGLEGPVSAMEVQASLFIKFAYFKIIQTFFINAVSGSIIAELSAIVQNPGGIVTLLANALPNRSSFFIQIQLVDTFLSLSVELLRLWSVGSALARSIVGPKLTEDERRTTWMWLRPFADPWEFEHAEVLGGSVLYFVVFFVYAPMAPITSIFMFTCFLIMGVAYRHQFIFCYRPVPDSGGKLWIEFMRIVPRCLFIAEATISGFLAAKSAPVASALMIPLICITILFNLYIQQKHFHAASFLPGCKCVEQDQKNNIDGPMDLRFISNHYVQPELRDKELYPSNASWDLQMSHGIVNPDDV